MRYAGEDLSASAQRFVADFVGEANLLRCRVVSVDGRKARVRTVPVKPSWPARCGPLAGFRRCRSALWSGLKTSLSVGVGGLHGEVDDVVFSGATAKLTVAHRWFAVGRERSGSPKRPGQRIAIGLSWSPDHAVIVA